jgi:hypothetical protein
MQASFVVFDLTITLIARDFPDKRRPGIPVKSKWDATA